ncbi:MAG: DUF3078 domain-containing protein [Bacteroidales bacterium]|nr:DUF3078 domain-containing protein [Bacteroidales bacterium]
MKKIICILALFAAVVAQAQNTQEAAAEAAATLSEADEVPVKEEKPKYWTTNIMTSLNFGQTYLFQWVAGGYNTVTLSGNADLSFNYEKDKVIGMNRLQMEYGFMWSADKPIIQKTKDRIYLESKWGYQTGVKNLSYSANLDFRTQFSKSYDYKVPGKEDPTTEDWKNARVLKSGLFAPGYLNIGIGALWTPAKWISINFAPLSGGVVLVDIPQLRETYGMEPTKYDESGKAIEWRESRMEFGAQLKVDMAWVINDAFSYTTQFTAFYNYLKPKVEPRLTWDNKIYWKLHKFFTLSLSTNLIYDPLVLVRDTDKDGTVDKKGIQFKEYLEIGFAWSFAKKL